MTTIESMKIRGIRSFDPSTEYLIEFSDSLTLIVGFNDTGKSTILDCLRFSCTGVLPPDVRCVHSFIHDTMVDGETEVDGMIKLQLKTPSGNVTATRTFLLAEKDSNMEYTQVNCMVEITDPQTGEGRSHTINCLGMDKEIPNHLGVSKAILDNVIFVHQNEANWPLEDDPSKIRKRFDDLFSVTKWLKQLDISKQLKMNMTKEKESYEINLNNLRARKDAAEIIRSHGKTLVYHDDISQNSTELQMAEYEDDIDSALDDQQKLIQITQVAIEENDDYYNTFVEMLVDFYKNKIEELNRIIKKLWQQMYTRHDIDYIKICIDSESVGSYSFKILKQIGEQESEIREKCSMTEKIQASLVIRLALAEMFCKDFGVLVLDEPTIALDRPNIESLAAAILRILENWSVQKKFQLIVITHDEYFAKLIGQRPHAEKYYRVTKDYRQSSKIESKDIDELYS